MQMSVWEHLGNVYWLDRLHHQKMNKNGIWVNMDCSTINRCINVPGDL